MSKHISTRRESRNGASVDRIARLPSGSLPLRRTWPISLCIGLAIGSIAVSPDAFAGGPTGGTVVGGTGSITQSGNETVINQISQRLALNWETFNLKANESVLFNQPGRSAVALNRILDQNPSQIFGKINSNGQVFLINTHGIIFGATAQMNVGGLMASTLDLTPKDFLAGNYSLNAVGAGAGIVNHGLIQAASGGSVALVGGSVANHGVILANYGSINLDGAEHAVLDFDGNGLINIQITGELKQRLDARETAVSNTGTLKAEGGTVVLQASAAKDLFTNLVNNSGVIDASGISTDGGVVRLVGSGGNVGSSGSIATTGDHGGRIELLSDKDVMVTGGILDASGRSGGGAIRVGGGVRGGEGLPVAARSYVASGASLNADATGKGDGGSIAVFSRDNSVVAGSVSARGGVDGGNGGFVETSSHGALTVTGTPQVTARHGGGAGGNWLVDPNNIDIVAGNGNTNINAADPFVSTDDGASLGVDLITEALAGGASVTITTGTGGANTEPGDITLDADLDYDGTGAGTLTLDAANDIVINNSISDSDIATVDSLNLSLLAGNNIVLNNDIALGTGSATLTATAGSISRTAGTISGDALTLTAGGTNGSIGASDAIRTNVSSIVFSANGNGAVNIIEGNGANVSGTAGGGNVAITSTTSDLGVVGTGIGTAGGAVTLEASGSGARINIGGGVAVDTTNGVAAGADVTLVADNADIFGTINAGTAGIATIRQATAGRPISLGPDAPDPAPPQLGVTAAELDLITANTIVIGDANSGNLSINEAIAPAHATTLSLNTGGSISQVTGAAITVDTLTGSSVGATTLGEGNHIGNLGGFTASSFSLANADPLTLVGDVTTGGAQTYDAAILLGSNTVLTATNGAVSFAGTVDNATTTARALTVNAGSGAVTFGGAVGSDPTNGALGALIVNSTGLTSFGNVAAASLATNAGGSTRLGGNITTSGTQTYNDVVTLGSNAILTTTNSAVNFAGTVDNATTTARALTVNAGSGAVTFGGAVGSDPTNGALGALIVNSTGLTSFGNVAAASLATNAGGSTLLGGNITTSGTQTYNDAVTLGSNAVLTTTNSAVNFAGTVDNATTTARALTVNAGSGAVTFGGAVGSDPTNGALGALIVNSTGLTSFGNVAAASLATNAGGSTRLGGNITTSGTQTYNDVVTLGSNAVLTTTNSAVNFAGTVDNATTTARALTVNAGSGAVTFGEAVGSDPTNGALGALIVNSTGLTSLGNVAAASLATNAGGSTLLGGNITTSGTQTYNDAVTLGSNAVLTTTNSAVNFAGTVDNATTTARALTVNAGTGAVTFGGAVGGDTTNGALDGLTTHSGSWSAGTLNIGSGGLSVTTTTGDITQGDKFVVIGLSDFNSGSHAITLDSANDFQGDVSATGTGVSITDVNDLKIAALNSGANGKVSLIAGGVLTLPVGSIDTGTANLTLTSNGGSLSTLGSLTGADISLTGLGLTLNNDVTATGTLSLFSGAAISQNAGVITAGTLTGSSAGATTLINLNHVGALGNFSAAGFNLINAQALAVTGTVDGGTSTALTTTVGDLAINGAVKGTTTTLTSAGAINEGAGGVITAGTLTGSSTGSTTLLQANQASALGAFTTGGDFAFNNAQSLTVSNAPSANGGAGNLTLTTTGASSDLTLASTLTGNTVSLGAGRNINQTAGAIHATTLTGSSVGSTTLNGANQIGALGNFSATGFNLINAQALAVTGTVDGGANTVLTTTAGDLAITGAVKGTTTTALTSAGAITEGAGGVITAGTLTGSSAGSTTLNGLNHIGTLGNFSAAGFSLVNAQALAVTGTVDGGASTTLTTTAGDLAINGAVKGTTTTTLTSAGAITEGAGGVITAGTLAGSSTGSTTLLQANQVGTLGAFTTGGDFAFNNAQSLTVNNAPSANGGAGNLTLTTSGAGSDLILASTLTGNTVSLGAGRNINQTAGAIYATILTGSSAGSTTLIGLNQIGALGNFSAAGFNLINAQALAVTGTVDGGTSTALTTTVGDLAINGAVKGSTTTTLTSAGAITEGAAGVITAGTLTGSSAGSTALNAANHVGNLGAFTTGGDFTFNNAQSLTVNNAPSANGGAGNLTLTTTGASSDLTLASTLTGNIVSLGAGRNINQTAGAIHATTLTGSSVGSTTLNGANLIGTLGSFTAANFVLTNAQSLAMTGTVDGGASTALKTTAGNLAINGAVKGTTTTLTSAGAITEGAGGVITAGTLTGSSTGSATLNGANHIGTLGSFTAANLALTNAQALAVTGPVNGGASTALKTTAGNLAINGAVKGTTTTLTSAGAITEGAGGVITAGTLTGSSAGSTALNAANHVGNLGAFTTGSDFAFNNAQSLTVNNAPSANGGAGNLTLTTTGASSDLTLASTLTGNTVSLGAGRNINQTTGTIHASTLTGSSVGSTTLAGANHVGTLGNFSAAGFNLINAQALAVTGPVDGGASTSLTTTAGNLAINGSVKGTTTTLISAGAITEGAGGSITANLLTGHSVGNTTLDGNNHINMLGSFSADFSLTNGQTLTVDGPLDGGPTVALTTTAGDLIINGAISGTATMLTSAGAIVEGAGGVITADTLSGSSAGSTSLLGANKVAALGAFTSGGDFAFNTIQTLTVNDAPSANGGAGNLTLTTSGAGSDLILANTLTGNTVGLVAGRNISQTAGAIHATTLTGSSTGSTTLTGANQIGTLGSFTAANFALTNAQGLVVTGAVDGGAGTTLKTTAGNLAINGAVKGATTTLTSAGAISEGAGGAITAGTLTGSSTGATTLTGTNRIGTLGSFTAATFSLSNAQALTVTGAVNGGSGTTLSTSAGDLAINGAVNGTTTTLTSAGAITEGAGGTITADTLTGSSSGAATLNGANRIGTLGSFTAANFALTNAQALAVTGPVNGGASTTLTTTAGDLAINGAISGTATTLNSAGAINEGAGGAITAGTLSGNAVGPTVLGSAVSPNKNMVDTLGNFTSLAGFSMTNDKTLTLASVAGSAFTVNAGTSPFYLSVAHGDLFQLGTAPVYDGVGVWGSTGRMGTGTNPIYVVGTGLQNIANVGLPPAYFYAVDSSGNLLPLGGGFAINVPTVSGAGSAQNGIHGDSYIDPSVITANYRSYGIVPSGVRLPPDQQSGCDPDQPDQAACQDPDALGMVMPWPNAPQ